MVYRSFIIENLNYSITIDLKEDLQKYSKRIISNCGFKCGNNEDYIRLYFNMQKRLISAVPRSVVKSKEFKCPHEYYRALEEIENKIQNGENLVPYMSDKILDLKYEDLLLSDWNIHHLHLSRRKRADGFVKRSDYELFVYISNETIYFIQIYPHSKKHLYSTQEMVRIIHNNWPNMISKFRINGVLGGTDKITDEGHDFLRKKGVNTFVDLGNETLYVPFGGGYASNGSSVDVTRQSDYWKSLMIQCQHFIVRDIKRIIKAIYQIKKENVSHDLIFTMIYLNGDEMTLLERNNKVCLQLFRTKKFYRICCPQDLFVVEKSYIENKIDLVIKNHKLSSNL